MITPALKDFPLPQIEAIHGERLSTWEIMRQTVFEYIEVDYNRVRRYSFNGFINPVAFEGKIAY